MYWLFRMSLTNASTLQYDFSHYFYHRSNFRLQHISVKSVKWATARNQNSKVGPFTLSTITVFKNRPKHLCLSSECISRILRQRIFVKGMKTTHLFPGRESGCVIHFIVSDFCFPFAFPFCPDASIKCEHIFIAMYMHVFDNLNFYINLSGLAMIR